ncbi:MAG: hypothetical protein ACU0DI_10665 [Paracoccaceae bacterium]
MAFKRVWFEEKDGVDAPIGNVDAAACAKAELQNEAPYWKIHLMAAKLIVGRPF